MLESGQGILTSQAIHHECSYCVVMSLYTLRKKQVYSASKSSPKRSFICHAYIQQRMQNIYIFFILGQPFQTMLDMVLPSGSMKQQSTIQSDRKHCSLTQISVSTMTLVLW